MKMAQCSKFKNHFYDADKYDSCPHCAKLEANKSQQQMSGNVTVRLDTYEQNNSPAAISDPDKTTLLTSDVTLRLDDPAYLMEKQLQSEPVRQAQIPADNNSSVANQVRNVGLSGSIADIKTVAMYGFEDEISPVVGWLVAINGSDKGLSYSLKSGKNTIGRNGGDSQVDVSIDNDHAVSRGTQAVLIFEPKKKEFLLQATDGASLVYLNDDLLMNYVSLNAYDKITIGETDMLFVPFCGEKFSW